jgi:hypothetical protein
MSVFQNAVALISQRLDRDVRHHANGQAVVAEVADRASVFVDMVESARKRYHWSLLSSIAPTQSQDEVLVTELVDQVAKALVRFDKDERESLVFWLLQEVAARNAVERMAAERMAAPT